MLVATHGLGLVVPRDRIELSTPGFSVEPIDVHRRPLGTVIVFKRRRVTALTSADISHRAPTNVSG